MRKYIKIILLTLLLIPFISLKAVSSDKVNYKVNKYYINSEIEIAGGLQVKQLIEVEGTFNGYYQEFSTKNTNVVQFTGLESDLKGSSIYNPTSIEKIRIGRLINTDDLNLVSLTAEKLEGNVEYFEEKEAPQAGDKGVYSLDKDSDGNYTIKMYNETVKGKTVFYLEYVITNVLVEHNDCAEFYYNFFSKEYNDSIKDVKIFVALPYPAQDVFKLWAHGQRDASIIMDEDKRAVVAEINNYQVGSGIDIRLLFDRELFQININQSKKSGLDAIPIIEKIETERAEEANKYRKMDAIVHYGLYGLHGIYILFLLGITAFIYFKYDREYKSSFKGEYYREFIEDYPVEEIEYLLNKNITSNSFSASILNLIYKKKIKVEKIEAKKEDYKLIKNSDEDISDNELKIMNLLFDEIGNGQEVTLSEVKKESNNVSSDGKNAIYDIFTSWKDSVTKDAVGRNFYIDNQKIKITFSLFALVGIGLFFLDRWFLKTPVSYITLVLSILFIIYVVSFKKRTVKGNDDYNKWNGFKKFLNDFGRLDEKELPEIILWEKYLVYASVFGLADKVSKTMKIKFSELHPNDQFNPTFSDYYMMSSMSNTLTKTVSSSVTKSYSAVQNYKANNMSSGSGMGGGFSSGGGFGGGGGARGGGF